MTETCQKVRDAVALEGKAPSDETLVAHLETCDECKQFIQSARQVELELDALGTDDVSDDVVADLLARPELARPVKPVRSRQWMLGLAAAAVIGFVAVNVTFMGSKDMGQDAPVVLEPRRGGGGGGGRVDPKKEDADEGESFRERALDEGVVGGFAGGVAGADSRAGERLQQMPEEEIARLDDLTRNYQQEFRDNALGSVASPPGLVAEDKLEAPKRKAQVAGNEMNLLEAVPESVAPAPPPPPEDLAFSANVRVVAEPEKRVHVDPVAPEAGKDGNATVTVRLMVSVDADGNVEHAAIVGPESAHANAAKEAVMQWKYAASDTPRAFEVEVSFPPVTPEPDVDPEALHSYLNERSQVDGLRFREAKGYWASTYIPGDPAIRSLKARLAKAAFDIAPHLQVRPVDQPFDAPFRGALSLSIAADRRAIAGPSRVLLQVGIKGADVQGRRRPPMNVGVVLDVGDEATAPVRALLRELELSKQMGDRFRLIVPGQGEVVSPDAFEHGPIRVALDELDGNGSVTAALEHALGLIHAGDDPTMPLGTSLVVLVTTNALDDDIDALSHLAYQSAIGGVPVSVVGVNTAGDRGELEPLALAGQGRHYLLDRADDAGRIVEQEMRAGSRAVARALRLRIKLAAGVKLVDVLGSQPLSERQAAREKRAEKSIDLRLSRNLGIEADRGEDEDGIQILIPSYYAGDTHTILLDVVAERPGPLAEVTAKYKDLTLLRNTVARASASVNAQSGRADDGPLESNVTHNYSSFRLARTLDHASERLRQRDSQGAVSELKRALARLMIESRTYGIELDADLYLVRSYLQLATSSADPRFLHYLADSMQFAAASKLSPAAVT